MAIARQAGTGDFHHQDSSRGMLATVVFDAALYDGDVGLRLGLIIEPDRSGGADVPTVAERRLEHPGRLYHGGVVLGALRLGDDQLTADQFDVLVLAEHAELDQPIVLGAVEAARLRLVGSHEANRSGG